MVHLTTLVASHSVTRGASNGRMIKVKYARYRPTCSRGVHEVKAPTFHDTRHTKAAFTPRIFRDSVNPGHMDLSDASEKNPQ